MLGDDRDLAVEQPPAKIGRLPKRCLLRWSLPHKNVTKLPRVGHNGSHRSVIEVTLASVNHVYPGELTSEED